MAFSPVSLRISDRFDGPRSRRSLMRLVLAVGNAPNRTTGGGALTSWSVMHALLDDGHSVGACILVGRHTGPGAYGHADHLRAIERLGVAVEVVQLPDATPADRTGVSLRRLRRGLAPPLSAYYPTAAASTAAATREAVRRLEPDAIFAYHFEPLAALRAGPSLGVPLVAGVGDPSHLPAYYRWRLSGRSGVPVGEARRALQVLRNSLWMTYYMRRMMTACDVVGAFAAHHAQWFKRIGVHQCQYFRTPVVDEGGAKWAERRKEAVSEKPKILLIGHLAGIATLSGLYLFAREVLPVLEAELGTNGFEVHVVGGYEPPTDLATLLSRPSVRMRGQIEPADDEFLSCHVLVVPTPIPLGIRVRIVTGFSFGCTVVAHASNALGIPELRHGENVLLARDGASMAEMVLTALGDSSLRQRLGAAGRNTFETFFAPEVAGRRIAGELVGAARS
jgi:glycosyltransferase involved in cell wall biosynthesis